MKTVVASPRSSRDLASGVPSFIHSEIISHGHASSTNRQSFGGQGYSPPRFPLPLEYGMEGQQRSLDDNSTVSPVRRLDRDRQTRRVSLEAPRRSDRRFRSREFQASYQDEGCTIG